MNLRNPRAIGRAWTGVITRIITVMHCPEVFCLPVIVQGAGKIPSEALGTKTKKDLQATVRLALELELRNPQALGRA